jgi:hypothetical protein
MLIAPPLSSPRTASRGHDKIEAARTFDYELKTSYEFKIRANDGIHTSWMPVRVDIVDLNDNKPVFEKPVYEFKLDENSPIETLIGQVRAVDADGTAANNQILYKFATHADENVFTLNRITGDLTAFDTSKLDRETQDTFNISIVAYNPSISSMQDTAVITIKLNDLNDNTPKFDRTMYQVYVREKLRDMPYLMMKLAAADNDLGRNGTVMYELVRSTAYDSNLFRIDQNTGELYLQDSLDADLPGAKRVYELTVKARDLGGLSSECLVQMNLIDINDHAPVMNQPQRVTFDFDENDATVVTRDELFRVVCYDADATHSEIEYSLVWDELGKNDSAIFSIDRFTGQVRSSDVFDFESIREYKFKVVCMDRGIVIDLDRLDRQNEVRLSVEQVFVVKVNDLDDNEPLFSDNERGLCFYFIFFFFSFKVCLPQ